MKIMKTREELIKKSIELIGEIIDNCEADAINLPDSLYRELKSHLKRLDKYLATQPQEQDVSAEEIPSNIITEMQMEFEPNPDTNFKQGMYSGYAFGLKDGIKYAQQKCYPKVICTIGSSRFCEIEAIKKWEFEKQGFICLGMHLLPEWYAKSQNWKETHHGAEQENVVEIMDNLHLRKIDMADKVFVINYQGYIGERTRFEINYAKSINKPIEYLEPIDKTNIKDNG